MFLFHTKQGSAEGTDGQAHDEAMTSAERRSGVVIWFNERGYGFIRPEDGTKDLFVHYSGIAGDGHKMLYAGDRVEFDVVEGDRGPKAINLIVVEGSVST